MVKEVKLI